MLSHGVFLHSVTRHTLAVTVTLIADASGGGAIRSGGCRASPVQPAPPPAFSYDGCGAIGDFREDKGFMPADRMVAMMMTMMLRLMVMRMIKMLMAIVVNVKFSYTVLDIFRRDTLKKVYECLSLICFHPILRFVKKLLFSLLCRCPLTIHNIVAVYLHV